MTHEPRHPIRVAVVGTGNVGATFAYAIVTNGLAAGILQDMIKKLHLE